MVGSPELSLVALTVLSQLAVGTILILFFWRLTNKELFSSEAGKLLTRKAVYIALVAVVAGAIISSFHLGQPLKGYRALFYNLSSWMGKEALLLALFSLALLIYAFRLIKGGGPSIAFEGFAAVVGLLAVLSSAMIYASLGSVAAWNSAFTIAFFVISLLLLGDSMMEVLMGQVLRTAGNSSTTEMMRGSVKMLSSLLLLFVVAGAVATAAYVAYLSGKGGTAAASVSAMLGNSAFWARLGIGFGLPLVLVVMERGAAMRGEMAKLTGYAYAVFIFLLAGELLGRMLFYSSSALYPMGGAGTPY